MARRTRSLQSVDYVISLSPTDEGESVTGEYNYLITLIDESETQNIKIQAKPNMETLGSVASNAEIFNIGDTVELTATTESGSTFLAWATSTDPDTMEILSTSSTYSFELTMDSPRTYYALFNQTPPTKQTVGDLIYTFYNEAKLAEITGTDSSFQGGDYTISPTVTSGENSYKVYSIGDDAFLNCRSLTSITIPEGVTSIGDYAFQNCSVLTEITIPEGVTSIGGSAFYRCSSLTSITIPEGVTSIGERAFFDCTSLTEITIPEGVTEIGEEAFFNCRKLTSVSLPSTLTSIGSSAFCDCSSLEGFYGNGNSYYKIADGGRALLVDGGETLYAYAIGNAETSYEIPEGVTSIGNNAFRNCSSLTSITILEGVTSIGDNAFESCGSLTTITIPEGVISIGDYAFYNCSSLTQITINGDISTLESYAFSGCRNLTKLTLGANVESIPSNLFTDNNLTRLTEIVVEEGSALKDVALPGYETWYKDDDPTEVTSFKGAGTYLALTVTALPNDSSLGSANVSAPGAISYGDTITLRATPSGSTFLAWATSTDPNTMEILSTSSTYSFELTMDSPRTYYALFNQKPSTRQPVGNLIYTFYNEAKLASVTGTNPDSLPSGDYTIPSVVPSGGNSYKVYSIGNSAFYGCSGLISITIPKGVTSIGEAAFAGCSGLTEITIPEGVTSIGGSAFSNCSSLTSIILPSTLTSIGHQAFYNCSGLTSITIPEGVTSIGSEAFRSCSGLTEITIPEGVTSISQSAFSYCSRLTSITILEGVTSIGQSAFSYCSSLTSIILPNTLTSIGEGAFSNCSNLTSIKIPEGVTSIGFQAFSGCSGLTSISLPSKLTSIDQDAFNGCSGLTEITINGNISTLSLDVFRNCTNLTKLTLGANVESIPSNLFTDNNLTNLTEIVVEENSSLSEALPGYGNGKWVKDGGSELKTSAERGLTQGRTFNSLKF